ncbi:hypothetical protein KTR10_02220 [Candidatus Kaiserbacteria bacterium]|nr:hypothetical protein [Candidatus Kaiserbacteria bacterium]
MAWRKSRRRRTNTRSLRHQLLFGGGFLLILGGLLYGVWYGTHHDAVALSEIRVSGGATVSHEKVEQVAWRALSGNQYGLISKRFAYLYPQQEVIDAVSHIPRVHGVSVTRDGKILSIHFEEYIPTALWCDSLASISCVFLTEDGFGFDKAPQLTGGVFVRYVTALASSTPHTQAIDRDIMVESTSFIHAVREAYGFGIAQVVYTADGDVEYHREIGGVILTTQEESVEEALENLDTVLSSEEFSHLRTEPFLYVDLRFGNRVFVKED